jgi:hypothetical protein
MRTDLKEERKHIRIARNVGINKAFMSVRERNAWEHVKI